MGDDPPEGQRTQETQKDVRAKREAHAPEGQRTQETHQVAIKPFPNSYSLGESYFYINL